MSNVYGIVVPRYGVDLPPELLEKIEERQEARRVGDFERADKIRSELQAVGVWLEDTDQGVRWKRKWKERS